MGVPVISGLLSLPSLPLEQQQKQWHCGPPQLSFAGAEQSRKRDRLPRLHIKRGAGLLPVVLVAVPVEHASGMQFA